MSRGLGCLPAPKYIYPITLNGYIYSPGKKIEKIKKNRKNLKKLKIIGTISGALARSLIPYHIEWLYIQSWQIIEKIKKNRKNLKKLKIIGTISGALARSLMCMYIVAYIEARIYRGWHESQECAIFKLR